MTIFLGLDFGIMAAASVQIKECLEMDNLQFGLLQTMMFLGIIAGKKSDVVIK